MLSIIPEKSQVILFGTSRFEDKCLPPLPAVENNIQRLRQLFVEPEIIGIPDENLTVILNMSCDTEILPNLITTVKKAQDALVIYYAGCGIVGKNQELYLATRNTMTSLIKYSALAFSTIKNMATRLATANKLIFILDCSYSGKAIEESYTAKNKQIFTMTATSSSENAIASPGATYSAFTNELLRIFVKGIDNNQETLTLWDIYENVKNQAIGKHFPAPCSVIFNGAHNLKIAKNRA